MWDDELNSNAITQRDCFEDETSAVLTDVTLCSLSLQAAKALGLGFTQQVSTVCIYYHMEVG